MALIHRREQQSFALFLDVFKGLHTLLPVNQAQSTSTMKPDTSIKLVTHRIRVSVIRGPDTGLVREIKGPCARVGSAKDADFPLSDPTVSRLHLELRLEGEHIRVIDMQSRNGTSVDGVRVKDAYARPDSSIGIGETVLRLRMLPDTVELPLSQRDQFGPLLGRSVPMRRVFALLERIAPTDTTVLIEGETGTGKDVVAQAIHHASLRKQGPFVVFDCSAVSANLIESELFGHVRAAFTGALNDRMGKFEAADGGTLFLDEVGELPLELQPKLLRVLENREVCRVGSNNRRKVNVRILSATNKCLAREVDRGRFREDLYYRLAVLPLRLPPLRERPEDIPLLVRRFESEWGRPDQRISDEMVYALKGQSWPGNVRELKNRVDLMLSLGLSHLGGEDAAHRLSSRAEPVLDESRIDVKVPFSVGLEQICEHYKKLYFDKALRETGGNISQAAKLSGMGRAFVQKVVKRHGLGGDDGR